MMLPSIFGKDLFNEMMNTSFEDDFFGNRSLLYGNQTKSFMKTDIKEVESGYELSIDLPGFQKEDISAQLENGYLTVTASQNTSKEEKDEDGRYIRRERYTGNCTRSFYVGEGIAQEDIHAKYKDGILRLTVPKKDAEKIEAQKYIAIEG
ncbi:MAG: Hsp20/alpha crystallin family protein [Lachnospiraceae bacterium]|nr:Hsp20/alpha crystallin family protein [Lachnospiraceae bacterium]